jgi:hypothetical protein
MLPVKKSHTNRTPTHTHSSAQLLSAVVLLAYVLLPTDGLELRAAVPGMQRYCVQGWGYLAGEGGDCSTHFSECMRVRGGRFGSLYTEPRFGLDANELAQLGALRTALGDDLKSAIKGNPDFATVSQETADMDYYFF